MAGTRNPSPQQHEEQAINLLNLAKGYSTAEYQHATVLASAQVHATLALVAAVEKLTQAVYAIEPVLPPSR